MPCGTLEVMLQSARGISSGDFFSKTDAYVIISCGSQHSKSNVASNQGGNPSWNQRFEFYVNDGITELSMKVMDKDFVTADDELGLVTVPLNEVFKSGKTAAKAYNVVLKNGNFKGEIWLSLSFTPE